MPRFFLPPDQCRPPELLLEGDEAHHALHVLRLRKGDAATVLNGSGDEFRCEVRTVSKRSLVLSVQRHIVHPAPQFRITLFQALPKGKLFESIVQKATELGAFRVIPLLTERVVVQLSTEEALAKAAKWREVAVEALKQCGSPWLPKVEAPMTLSNIRAELQAADLTFLASLEPASRHPRACLTQYWRESGHKPASVNVLVGPEGDFSPEETADLLSQGARPITLGSLVLRTETAATYCLSILNYELSWTEEPARVPK